MPISVLDAPPQVNIVSPAEIEQQFKGSLHLIELGQVSAAIPVLEHLYTQTRAPRIRLELARALMLARQWKRARTLFVEAFKDDPPSIVKSNILTFLNTIDRQRGKLTLSASFARYGNPLQQPGTYTLNFAGIELTYQPDETYRNLWGVTIGGTYSKEFQSGWQVSANASYRDLPHDLADRFVGDVSLSRMLGRTPFEVKVGVTRLGQKRQSFSLPYIQAVYTLPVGRKSALRPTATLGYYAADIGQSASGVQGDAFIPLVYAPVPTRVISIGPTILRRNAGYDEQAYTSVGVRAIATVQTSAVNVEAGFQGTITRFDAIDPFWGARRLDHSVFATATLSSYKLRLGPFIPAVGLTCILTRSTIVYYRQRGCDSTFEVRKIF